MKVADLKPKVRQALLEQTRKSYPEAEIDRWSHIKWTDKKGSPCRFKFQANTVRLEIKRPHGWDRLHTYNLKQLAKEIL